MCFRVILKQAQDMFKFAFKRMDMNGDNLLNFNEFANRYLKHDQNGQCNV